MKKEKDNQDVLNGIVELYTIKERFKIVEKTYKSECQRLQELIEVHMAEQKISKFDFVAKTGIFKDDNKTLKVTSVTPKSIVFDPEKLEKKLPRNVVDEVILKEITVDDWAGLVCYLKSCGADAKIVKSFLNIKKTVDSGKLNQLSDLGEISQDDIEGCYEVTERKGYIRIDVTD